MRRLLTLLALVVVPGLVVSARADRIGRFAGSIEHPAIDYAGRPVDDVVSRLKREIEAGTVSPRFESDSGYLRASTVTTVRHVRSVTSVRFG